MKNIINFKYTAIGLLIISVVSYLLSVFTGMPFWAAFVLGSVAIIANGFIAEYEDNLPGGFNNPMTPEEIKTEYEKRKKKYLPIRIIIWVIFITLLTWMIWMYINKNV